MSDNDDPLIIRPDDSSVPYHGRKKFAGLGKWEWVFLMTSLISILACIALSIVRLVQVVQDVEEQNSNDFTFTILLIMNACFCLFYVFHGVLKELQHEVYVFICATIVVFFYIVINYIVNVEKRNKIKLARLIVGSVLCPADIILAAKVAHNFGWLQFKILGASEIMQRMYYQACWFSSLIKFDLQIVFSFLVLVLENGFKNITTSAIITLSVGLPVSVIWTILGRISMQHESKVGMTIFGILGLAAPAFVIARVVKMFENLESYVPLPTDPLPESTKLMLLYSTLIIGALVIVVRGIVYIEMYWVCANFGKGLRQRAAALDLSVLLLRVGWTHPHAYAGVSWLAAIAAGKKAIPPAFQYMKNEYTIDDDF